LDQTQVIHELWKRGILLYKLHSGQLELFKWYESKKRRKSVWNCARRFGKSYALCVKAIDKAFSKRNSDVKYLAPTAKAVKKIIQPLFREITFDCPKEFKPRWNSQDGCYYIDHTESVIHVIGCDKGNHESARGMSCDLAIIDEAGFIDDLNYIVSDILLPQTLTTDGDMIISSTPPRTPAHQYVEQMLLAIANGNYIEMDVYKNPMLRPDQILEYMAEAGGEESSTWRREYLCQVITDKEFAIVPEFLEREKDLVKVSDRPPHYYPCVVGDLGFVDLTAFLFGYYDFKKDIIVIEAETIYSHTTSKTIVDKNRTIEAQTFDRDIKMRYTDGDLITINDMCTDYNYYISPVRRDSLEAGVNEVRLACRQGRIAINPRCSVLISHVKYGVWDSTRRKFDRSSGFGHFDALAALVYFVRHVDKTNPYPVEYERNHSETFYKKSDTISSGLEAFLRS